MVLLGNPCTMCKIAIIAILSLSLFTIGHPFVGLVESKTLSIVTDKEALVSFQSQLSLGPSSALSSWDQNSSPCNWSGVVCNKFGHRVIGLNLSSSQLSGFISPHIGNLSFLKSLQLQNNQLIGTIPNELCNLLRLKVLNLSSNKLEGEVPSNITMLRELNVLDLIMNNIRGRIPSEIGSLRKLQVLNLARNLLSGPIPKSIGNVSSLVTLDFGTNTLSGPIPSELSRLTSLKHLDMSINNLTGLVPPSIYNMSSLEVLALGSNHLWGTFPYNVGLTLPNLRVFYFCINEFTGRIPGSLHNLTNIQVIRMAHNQLTGTIPPGLENLPLLKMYNIGYNNIVSSGDTGLRFINSLTNSTQLNFLAFDGNLIEGFIPESIGNLSKVLSKLYMGSNQIRGSIPSSISQLTGLTLLNMSHNAITGPIPAEISQLQDLQVLDLANNRISSNIPESFGKLTKLNQLDLSGNELIGEVPRNFGDFSALNSIDLSSNMLNGSIPKEMFKLPISNFFRLSNNLFDGKLPQEIGLLNTAIVIDLCNNRLSGNIPSSISNCKSLEVLKLSRNSFSGTIPTTFGDMNTLETLDLSNNNLSGVIPAKLEHLNATQSLNLSYNDLEGLLPCGGVFTNLSDVNLQGNPRLSLHSACQTTVNHSTVNHRFRNIKIAVIIVMASLLLCSVAGLILCVTRKRKPNVVRPSVSSMGQPQLVKYDELRQATEDFNEGNVIGRGGFGTVFKGLLPRDSMVVAIKVLDLKLVASWKSFAAECEALRNIRHRNLVKLITSCSSLDSKNVDFLALVYEFLTNGSLDDWIKGTRRNGNGDGLSFMQRLNIIIDVASALTYLHHDSEVPVVHCDLKPSNILLDEDMTAKVGDFGLAKLLMDNIDDQHSISSSHVLKGSIGYMPPEYGLGIRPSTAGDTYSFGVTLLEMFTGKSPSQTSWTGGQNLIAWVKTYYPNQVMQVLLDPGLHQQLQSDDYGQMDENVLMDCSFSIFEVGLSCTVERPDGRISVRDALHKLEAVRDKLLKSIKVQKSKPEFKV